jgi:hypothetical protein
MKESQGGIRHAGHAQYSATVSRGDAPGSTELIQIKVAITRARYMFIVGADSGSNAKWLCAGDANGRAGCLRPPAGK